LLVCAAVSTPSLAQNSDLDKRTPSVYLEAEGSFSTHKSNTLNGTDFATGSGLEAGVWTGKDKNLGMAVRQSQFQTHFTQVDAGADESWTDFLLRYRLLWFYPTAVIGSCNLGIEKNGQKIVDLLCTTLGASLGIRVPVGQYVIVEFTPLVAKPVSVKDRLARDTTVDLRSDYSLGVSLRPKLPWLDINVGFRYRTYNLTIAGDNTREVYAGPYLGLALGFSF